MGLAFIKVYQLPYESLEKPEEFLKLANEALTFLRSNSQNIANITVHVWIFLISLFKGPNRVLVPEDGYVAKLTEIITNISKNSPFLSLSTS